MSTHTPSIPLRVATIVLREIRLPLVERFEISSGAATERRIALLELRHPEGPVAWSECVAAGAPNYSPETIDTAWIMIRDWLAPRALGRTFTGPEEVFPALSEGVRGHPMAKAAVEMGFWGMAAELRGVALASLLEGTRERVATGISLGIQTSPAALVERARAALEAGYRKVKLKIKPGADLAYVRAVREALGEEAPLATDGNAAYTLEDAGHLARLDPLGLLMLEQPLAPGRLLRDAKLQARLETPLCLDESVVDVADAEDMIELGAGRIVNIKPGRVGGLARARAIHDVCDVHDVPVWCGGMLETGIGRAYNVALASLPGFRLPGDLSPSRRYWERDVVTPEWTMDEEGWVAVPRDRPGLGVEVDRDRLEEVTVRVERLEA